MERGRGREKRGEGGEGQRGGRKGEEARERRQVRGGEREGRGAGKGKGRSLPPVFPTHSPSPPPSAHLFISPESHHCHFPNLSSLHHHLWISLQSWSKMGTILFPNGFSFCDLIFFFFQKNLTQNQDGRNKYLIRKSKQGFRHILKTHKSCQQGLSH